LAVAVVGYRAHVHDVGPVAHGDGFAAEQPHNRAIELTIPAEPTSVRLARLVTSGVATSAGCDVEEIDDLRIAVDEVCAVVLASGPTGPMRVRWTTSGDVLWMAVEAEVVRPRAPDELTEQILAVVADDVQVRHDNGRLRYVIGHALRRADRRG
jgi:serine/threonine-protein kinase RsbW